MRIIKNTKYVLTGLLLLIFEQTAGKYIAVNGAIPMLAFCFCVTASAMEDDLNYVVWVSGVLGALSDILSGHGFGTYTLTFVLSALATFSVRNKLFSSIVLFLAADIFILTFLTQSFYFLVNIGEIRNNFFDGALTIIICISVYNTVIVLILYPLLKKIFRR